MTLPEGADRHALLRSAAAALPGPTPRLDAELLLAEVLGEDRLGMLGGSRPLRPPEIARFAALLDRRRAHEPVAYILGRREFWSLELRVTPAVLVPRADSETLIEAALAEVAAPPAAILDLGTGSGALLLAALSEWPAAFGVGVDRSPAAAAVARGNAARLGLVDRAAFIVGDWAEAIGTAFDLILCNPPYVETEAELSAEVAGFEPAAALFGGADGMSAYRRLMPQLAERLGESGVAIVEIGAGQAMKVSALAAAHGLAASFRHDLSGHARAMIVRKSGATGLATAPPAPRWG